MNPPLALLIKDAPQTQRVAFINGLRAILSPEAPKNAVGAPILSDLDLLCATTHQMEQAAQDAGIIPLQKQPCQST